MKSRTKIIAVATAACAGVAMVSVGFASWVIAANQAVEVTGNVEVQGVNNNSVFITAVDSSAATTNSQSIKYGAVSYTHEKAGDITWDQWLTNSNDGLTESLTLNYDVTVMGLAHASSISVTIEVVEKNADVTGALDKYNAAVADKYIAGVGAVTIKVGTGTALALDNAATNSATKATYTLPTDQLLENTSATVNFTFSWGEAFKSGDSVLNPIEYYNAMEPTSENVKAAEAALNAIYAINGVSYKITFVAVV